MQLSLDAIVLYAIVLDAIVSELSYYFSCGT